MNEYAPSEPVLSEAYSERVYRWVGDGESIQDACKTQSQMLFSVCDRGSRASKYHK